MSWTVTINTPNGQAPPLVTGTFGGMSYHCGFLLVVTMCSTGADFLHSLMGEATEYVLSFVVTLNNL
jgi:hypothetical protein